MIETYQAILLAILQGLTEFLPISSSAHLVIPSLVLGWPDQGLAFDVAVHVGTLSAVLFYYRADLARMAGSWFGSLAGAPPDDDSRLVWYLALATLPAVAVGFFAGDYIESDLRSLPVIATTTLVFGLLLGIADRRVAKPGGEQVTLSLALLIGLAQAIAPIPGVSRSGVTMTAALLLGMSRHAAARFSFLLSIPVIAGAGVLKGWELANSGASVDWLVLAMGALVSGITAYLCIALFLRLLDRVGLMPFVYYRVVLAAALYALWLA
ncbi:MAG: undecaprenyl-diphosphate phosphatase [Halieaceae bacterium]|jgi:undecaprenyl-diphosphatase|nr:undecaprenyl-diphosphate phosphatase [Halieaceae bacterium]